MQWEAHRTDSGSATQSCLSGPRASGRQEGVCFTGLCGSPATVHLKRQWGPDGCTVPEPLALWGCHEGKGMGPGASGGLPVSA